MASDEDRLDRNYRSNNDSADRLREQISELKTSMAVVTTKFEGLQSVVISGFATVDSTVREFKSGYATKQDLDDVRDKVKDIQKILVRIAFILGTPLLIGIAAAGIHFASVVR